MSNSMTLGSSQPKVNSQFLACRLRRKEMTGRRGPVFFMAEMEIENVSETPIEIEYRMTALQYLNLVVHDSHGNLKSQGHFGDRFAPTLDPKILRLGPGEKFVANVHLFATVALDPVPKGTYVVQAVYEYNGLRAESLPVEVTV